MLNEFWLPFTKTPLFGILLTLLVYALVAWLAKKSRFHPLVNPVALSVALIVPFLVYTNVAYEDYMVGAQYISFLLGPATVALAVPLARQLEHVKKAWLPLVCGLLAGSLVAVLSVVLVAALLGAEDVLIISLAPKSATMPIAMGVSEKLGGLASLAAVGVMGTGVFGVMTARYIFKIIHIESPEIRGFMLGLTAHGIGVARGFQISNEIGTFAGLGMSLNGLLTAFLVPVVVAMHFFLF